MKSDVLNGNCRKTKRRGIERGARGLLKYTADAGLTLYPHQEEAILALMAGTERHRAHADRLGQVADRLGRALQGGRRGPALLLHLPDQGAGQREVLRAVPRARAGAASA